MIQKRGGLRPGQHQEQFLNNLQFSESCSLLISPTGDKPLFWLHFVNRGHCLVRLVIYPHPYHNTFRCFHFNVSLNYNTSVESCENTGNVTLYYLRKANIIPGFHQSQSRINHCLDTICCKIGFAEGNTWLLPFQCTVTVQNNII